MSNLSVLEGAGDAPIVVGTRFGDLIVIEGVVERHDAPVSAEDLMDEIRAQRCGDDDEEEDLGQEWIDNCYDNAQSWLEETELILESFGATIRATVLLPYWRGHYYPRAAVGCYVVDMWDALCRDIEPDESEDWQKDVRDARMEDHQRHEALKP